MMKPKTKKGKAEKVGKVMSEYKAGTLHSGKGGPVVKSRKQAVQEAVRNGRRRAGNPTGCLCCGGPEGDEAQNRRPWPAYHPGIGPARYHV